MNNRICIYLLLFALPFTAHTQNLPAAPEPARLFDFWIGEWELKWTDADGGEGAGKNVIRKILSEKVVEENFTATRGQFNGFTGKSWSLYNERAGAWKQTWVDNNGVYLDFTGDTDGDKRIFEREGVDPLGRPILQRMVFYNITNDSFIWDWEVSIDKGETWELRWRIFYQRVK